MNKTTRYLLYFILGMIIYYVLKEQKDGDALGQIHEHAPLLILTVFLLLLIVRTIISKRGGGES